MTDTETTELPTVYVRFLASGLTLGGTVWRLGAVLARRPTDADYEHLTLTEKQQRARWGGKTFYEHLTADEYAAAMGQPSVAPERAAVVPTVVPPPPAEDGITRGSEGAAPVLDSPTVTGASGGTPPPPELAQAAQALPPVEPAAVEAAPQPPAPADARWAWYAETNAADTLARVADMPEAEATAFLAYETANKARKSVIGPMTGV